MKANISRSARKGWAWILAALMVVSVAGYTSLVPESQKDAVLLPGSGAGKAAYLPQSE